jgi:hypothetical protein
MSNPLGVHIDWSNDFTYAGSGSDVSDDINMDVGMAFSRGKESSLAFSPPAAGTLSLALWNFNRDYSPGNTGGPLYGQLEPGKRLRVISDGRSGGFLRSVAGDKILKVGSSDALLSLPTADRVVCTVLIDDFLHDPRFGVRTVGISCLGMMSRLRGKTISTALYQNIRTDEAITIVLDAAGWPVGDRVLQVGNNTIDIFVADNEDAASVMIRILLTEGLGASLYEDAEGNIVFENSTSRETQTRSVVSQATYDSTASINVGLDYHPNFKNVILACRIVQQEREAQPLETIWTYSGDLVLAAGQVKKLIVRGSDPFLNAQIPTPFGTNDVQLLTPIVTLTSGTFTITWKGQTTGTIPYNATAADVQAELETTFGAGNFACGGGPVNLNPVSVMFIGDFAEAEQELMTVTSSLNSVSSLTTLDPIRTDDGAGTYTDTLIPRNTPITSGSFKLRQGSTTTPLILYTATGANVQTAWENTSQYDPGDVSASGDLTSTIVVNYTDGLTFPPSTTLVVDSTLMASRYKDALKVTKSVKGSGPDYFVVSGGVSMAIDRDNGGSLTLTITDDGAGSTLTGLQLRAQPVSVVRSNEVTYPETAADSEGQLYKPDVIAEIPLAQAQAIAQAYYDRYSLPRPAVSIRIATGLYSANLEQVLEREISDLVTVIEPHTGINETYFIESISQAMSNYQVITQLNCEKAM